MVKNQPVYVILKSVVFGILPLYRDYCNLANIGRFSFLVLEMLRAGFEFNFLIDGSTPNDL